MNKNDIFDSLVKNAFDFLNHAVDNFEQNHKYALISLASSIELLFKARLFLIDPMWVAEEPTEATNEKLLHGNLRTVSLELAKKRIESLSDEKIDTDVFKKLKRIARHRNRVVHFFHSGLNDEKQKKEIAGDISIAWFFLHKILTNSWGKYFSAYSTLISEFEEKIVKIHYYFSTIFNQEVKMQPTANTYTDCPVCKFKALDTNTSDPYVGAVCHVCGYTEASHLAIRDGEERDIFGHCLECGDDSCVSYTGYGALCANCNERFQQIVICENCGESFAGHDLDDDAGNYQSGCPFCEGKLGYLMDKDD